MFYISLQSCVWKKKVLRKYKIRAKNRIHQAFIRSKTKDVVHQLKLNTDQELEFTEDEVNPSISHPSNDSMHAVLEQCSVNTNDDIFNNDNIEYGSSSDNNNAWTSDDSHENIYCNEFENKTETRVFRNEEEKNTYILTGLRNWALHNVS